MNKIIDKVKNDRIINLIKKYSQGIEIYLVGGALRDFYLNKENFDKDLVVGNVNAEEFAKNLAKTLDATFVPLDEQNKIYRIMLKDKINCIDVAAQSCESIEEDLRRRDFTINSVALNLNTNEIIDVTGGINDLKIKKIKHISEQNFIDDPLRLLRTYRFGAMLGFELDTEMTKIIAKHSYKIKEPAVERINYELLRLFAGDYSEQMLLEMDKSGLLQEILPVSKELKTVPPNPHHHLDLFSHSIEVVKQIQNVYKNSATEVKAHLEKIDFGGVNRLAHLKFAGFLHDIGKPETWTIEPETGKHRFIKHDDVGSKMGAGFLKSIKFSKKQVDYISKMIKYHIYPSHVTSSPEINDKIYMRFIRKMEDEVIDVIILAMADRLSARGVEITDEIVKKNLNNLLNLLNFYINIKDSLEPLPKLLSGEEIMKILNLKPSQQLGEIINSLKEAQLAGDVVTKDDALKYIKGMAVSK